MSDTSVPGWVPEIHNHFHLYQAPGADYVAALDRQTAEIAAMRGDIAALRVGTYSLTQSINTLEDQVAIDLSGLTTAVEENTSVDASASTLIEGLADQVQALRDQLSQEPAVQAALDEFVSTLRGSSGILADAVTANTPATPEEPPAEGGVTDDGTEITPEPPPAVGELRSPDWPVRRQAPTGYAEPVLVGAQPLGALRACRQRHLRLPPSARVDDRLLDPRGGARVRHQPSAPQRPAQRRSGPARFDRRRVRCATGSTRSCRTTWLSVCSGCSTRRSTGGATTATRSRRSRSRSCTPITCTSSRRDPRRRR